jgi:hypothetical protein
MKAKFLTSISAAIALATIGSAAVAQSSTVPREIKLSQATQPAPSQPSQPQQRPTQPAPAPQANVSQDELQKFASAVKKLQPLQKEALSQISQAIQQQKLSEQRFGEIYQARQNPQAQPAKKITPQESKQFEQANAKITQIQQSTQSQMEQTVKSEGLDTKRFNEIFLTIRQNPDLLQKVQKMIQSPS